MLESLVYEMRGLKSLELSETMAISMASMMAVNNAFASEMRPCLNAIRCLPAFQKLDNMKLADLVKQDTAKSMLLGLTSLETFFFLLPAPEKHNGCGNSDEMAELYRSPAQVLAVRSRLDRDPFKPLDSEDSNTREVVIKFTNRFGIWNPHGTVPMGYEGIKDLEVCLVHLALRDTPGEAKDSYKEAFYSFLRWVSGWPFSARKSRAQMASSS